jgi:hypothetical protein
MAECVDSRGALIPPLCWRFVGIGQSRGLVFMGWRGAGITQGVARLTPEAPPAATSAPSVPVPRLQLPQKPKRCRHRRAEGLDRPQADRQREHPLQPMRRLTRCRCRYATEIHFPPRPPPARGQFHQRCFQNTKSAVPASSVRIQLPIRGSPHVHVAMRTPSSRHFSSRFYWVINAGSVRRDSYHNASSTRFQRPSLS